MENISELFDQEAPLYTGENAEKEIETVAQIQKLEAGGQERPARDEPETVQ